MSQRTRHFDLASGGWRGIDLRSRMRPMPNGQFVELEGCYVSSDGTQLKRIPGYRPVMLPRMDQRYDIAAVTAGNPTQVTLNLPHFGGANGTIFQIRIYKDSSSVDLNGTFEATATGANTFTIPVDSTGGTMATTGEVGVSRVRELHGFTQCHDHIVVVGEINPRVDQVAGPHADEIAFGAKTTVLLNRPHGYDEGEDFQVVIAGASTTTPSINGTRTATATSSHAFTIPVATSAGSTNPTETFAFEARISGFGAWVSQSLPDPSKGVYDDFGDFPPSSWRSFGGAFDLSDMGKVRRRAAIEASSDRVLIASPGYGCCFQLDVSRILRNYNSLREVIALGVPKGIVSHQTRATTGGSLDAGDYYVAIAYRTDESVGFGLMSEPYPVTVAANGGVDVFYALPWESLRELPTTCSIQFYIGTSDRAMRYHGSLVGVLAGKGVPITPYRINGLPAQRATRNLDTESMPMGSKFLRTVRGHTMFGGHVFIDGLFESFTKTAFRRATGGAPTTLRSVQLRQMPRLVGGMVIPSAYQGYLDLYNPPGIPKNVRLRKLTFIDVTHQWETDWDTAGSGAPFTDVPAEIYPNLGVVQISEQGFPGVTPASYSRVVERLSGLDVEGAARFNNGWLIATDRELFMYQWVADPRGSDPVRVNDSFGCNGSPNAMFEAEGMAGGISHRGPWLYGSQRPWIGEPIEPLFKKMLADKRGQMRHAWAAYDSTRRLVWFGLREKATGYAEHGTGKRGKVGCDKVLIYSIASDAWSTWTIPSHLGQIWDMREVKMGDGSLGMVFLAGPDYRNATLYAFDDTWNDGVKRASLIGLAVSGEGETQLFATRGDFRAAVKAGMHWVLVRDGAIFTTGRVSAVNAGSVDLGTPLALLKGDTLEVGHIPVRIVTQQIPSTDPDGKLSVTKIQVRGENVSGNFATNARFTTGLRSVSRGEIFGRDVIRASSDKVLGTRGSTEVSELSAEDVEVGVDIYSSSTFHIKSIFVEMGPGG